MDLGKTYRGETERPLSERFRLTAFWAGSLGLLINAFVYVVYASLGNWTPILFLEVFIYCVALSVITLSAYRRIYLDTVLTIALLTIYSVFWGTSFVEASMVEVLPIELPLTLFVPLFLVIILSFKLLFALSLVQFACVFLYFCEFGADVIGAGWAREDQIAFSFVMAVFSGFSFCALGVVAYARQQTDKTLFDLITEKEALASTDVLTGLMNRRAFMDHLRRQWPRRSTIRIAFVDLDHFKPLNDQYGHAAGDEILCTVAERLADIPRVCATARLGGDEFAVFFEEDLGSYSVSDLLGDLHAKIIADIRWESGLISMGASVGYVEGDTMKQTLSGLLRSADTAMRRAKASRLGWAIFNPEIDNAALATSTLEVELKSAIKNGQIKAAIQPIAHAKTREIESYELLARWTDSGFERDPSPVDFIPIAEKLGLLNEILWVTLDEALGHLDLSPRRLAINVSPAQLLASDFLDMLLGLLARHSVEPSAITIEITEEVAFRNVDRNIAVLQEARALGMKIALDDFGTGYSSLSMLDTLPLDKLKIDQSFVRKSDQSEQSKSILLAAIRLAKQLGLESCVEGIETQKFAARVTVLGADLIQGYWLGRPQLVKDQIQEIKLAS